MLITDKIPQYIFDLLGQRGVDTNDIMMATGCDMDDSHSFCDTYIVATLTKIYVVSGSDKRILLVDSSKFGKASVIHYSALGQINTLVTNSGIDPQALAEIESVGIEVIEAEH